MATKFKKTLKKLNLAFFCIYAIIYCGKIHITFNILTLKVYSSAAFGMCL